MAKAGAFGEIRSSQTGTIDLLAESREASPRTVGAVMGATEALILKKLANGPLYIRSFQRVKPVLDRMIERGAVRRVAPDGMRARNMVALPDGPAMPEIDRFAEQLADGLGITAAGYRIGIHPTQARRMFKQICDGLGAQAC
jgi:hypothetical protein